MPNILTDEESTRLRHLMADEFAELETHLRDNFNATGDGVMALMESAASSLASVLGPTDSKRLVFWRTIRNKVLHGKPVFDIDFDQAEREMKHINHMLRAHGPGGSGVQPIDFNAALPLALTIAGLYFVFGADFESFLSWSHLKTTFYVGLGCFLLKIFALPVISYFIRQVKHQ